MRAVYKLFYKLYHSFATFPLPSFIKISPNREINSPYAEKLFALMPNLGRALLLLVFISFLEKACGLSGAIKALSAVLTSFAVKNHILNIRISFYFFSVRGYRFCIIFI